MIKSIINKVFKASFRIKIKVQLIYLKKRRQINKNQSLFLLLTPEHKNLGDHAIAFSEFDFLKSFGNVIEITGRELNTLLKFPDLLKKLIGTSPIFFNGGGNLGTLWFEDGEIPLRKIINYFPENQIIVFPQTIFYENNEFGHIEFEKSKEIYNSCKNLLLTSREKVSFDIMNDSYNNVLLIPDMVLRLNCSDSSVNLRSGAMLLLRDDCEKTLDDSMTVALKNLLNEHFDDVEISDMSAENDVLPKYREEELKKKFSQFKSKELVITDRLHGMIFSAITGTPCIVLNSKSPKVKGVYDWIFKDCEYIIFTDDFAEMKSFIKNIKGKTYYYDNSNIMHYYDELKDLIKREITGE